MGGRTLWLLRLQIPMNRILGRELRSQFSRAIKTSCSQFREAVDEHTLPGCRAYVWKMADDFDAYVILTVAPKDDRFTLECAWSQMGRLPTSLAALRRPNEEPFEKERRFRLSELWPKPVSNHWWWLGPEPSPGDFNLDSSNYCLDQKLKWIQPQILAAMESLSTYGLPYFRKIAAKLDKSA